MPKIEGPINPELVRTYRQYISGKETPRVSLGGIRYTRAELAQHMEQGDRIGQIWVNKLIGGIRAESSRLPFAQRAREWVLSKINPGFYEQKLIKSLQT